MRTLKITVIIAVCALSVSCNNGYKVSHGNLLIEINRRMETRINFSGQSQSSLMKDFSVSEYLDCRNFSAKKFEISNCKSENFSDGIGEGSRLVVQGNFKITNYEIEKILEISTYNSFPDMAFLKLRYVNKGIRDVDVIKWVNNSYQIEGNGDTPEFWSFQGSSSNERKDWILPVDSSFFQKNYMGMNSSDYGGGIPMVDLWRRDLGIAIGHVDLKPRMVSFPIEKDKYNSSASISVECEFQAPITLNSGDTLTTFNSFVMVHKGDCFNSLRKYSEFMQASGIKLAKPEEQAYEAVWCTWGYERKFTQKEVIGTLPKVKELGLKWVDIDDGFQQDEGDWDADPEKFPGGGKDIRKMVDEIHAMGLKAKLWWAPLAADPGSKLLLENPDLMLLNSDGTPRFISYWNSYYMSPVYSKTISHTKDVLKMFLYDWDFDGLKMDGGFLNCTPPDYNPIHNLKYPEQSFENLPDFFKMIYSTAQQYKPNAVLQICPCGAAMSFFTMPYTNQTVASDPLSSRQNRIKAKTYKALLGNRAYYGDHVELSDGGTDFATQIGVGAVLGTKFTWPKDNPFSIEGDFVLTPEKEIIWKKWINIYNEKMLPKGEYLGDKYDIGYDIPEGHIIRKTDTLYFAFYSPEWNGEIEIRGLEAKTYSVKDYINEVSYGQIDGPTASMKAEFKGSLLIEVCPIIE